MVGSTIVLCANDTVPWVLTLSKGVTCGVCAVQTGLHCDNVHVPVCVVQTCRQFGPLSGNVQQIAVLNESFEHGCLQRAVTHSRFCRCHGHLNPTSPQPHVPVCALGHQLLFFETDEDLKNDTVRCDVCSVILAEHVSWWHCPENCDWDVCSRCGTGPPRAPAASDNEQDDNTEKHCTFVGSACFWRGYGSSLSLWHRCRCPNCTQMRDTTSGSHHVGTIACSQTFQFRRL